ncbi:MAG: HisA/HisF-related TIM barrel protein [Methylocystis sp.]|nr:HisA/HisF-related TIM barrel protein [Methylocystis sp.]
MPIATIAAAFPDLRIWLDSGARAGADLARLPICENLDPVIGSETFTDLDALGTHVDDQRIILSLDFRQQNFLGAEALLSSPNLWPRRVIVMTLDRVGTRGGPDIARLTQIRAKSPGRMFYAAGGVRGAGDLAALAKAGAAGALVSTALHEGALF